MRVTVGWVTAPVTWGWVTATVTVGWVTATVTVGWVTAPVTVGWVTATVTVGWVTAPVTHRFVGLVVRCPPRERKIPGSNPACVGIFSGSSHTSDSKIGIPVATVPGAWRYRVSAGTGWPGVSIL